MQVEHLVIGAGIAGASVAAELAQAPGAGPVWLVERESQPGYHATGRSAAVFAESYGPPVVRALTRASRAFLEQPPAGFSQQPLLTPLGAMFVAEPGQEQALAELEQVLRPETPALQRLDAAQACARLPALRRACVAAALVDPGVADIDVHTLHQGFLRVARQNGAQLRCGTEVRGLRREAGGWRVELTGGDTVWACVLVNAAGAWADEVAALGGVAPLGIVAKRRSAFVFAAPADGSHRGWPLAIGVAEDWYFKPDAGQILASPANADPVPPQDVQPEELDIALGLHRIQQMTTLAIGRPARSWAGLRSFVADGSPVAGYDAQAPGFFWLCGQGGYGIQTAPALARAAAALIRGQALPADLLTQGLSAAMLSPSRAGLRRDPATRF